MRSGSPQARRLGAQERSLLLYRPEFYEFKYSIGLWVNCFRSARRNAAAIPTAFAMFPELAYA